MANSINTENLIRMTVEHGGAKYLGLCCDMIDDVSKVHIEVDGQRSTHEMPSGWMLMGQYELMHLLDSLVGSLKEGERA